MNEMLQVEQRREGNENSLPLSKKKEIQCKNICITVNDWTIEEKSKLVQYLQWYCDKYIVCEEIGENGTPHLQGAFVLKNKDRFGGIMNKLGFKCHLEKMRVDWKQQVEYCSKGENVIKFSNDADDKEIKYVKKENFYPWQKKVWDICQGESDDTAINWVWGKNENIGKSSFVRTMGIEENACIIHNGKYSNIMNRAFMAKNVKLFLIDVPRNNGNVVSYDAIDSIKNGFIFNRKYKTGVKLINHPCVVVFSNNKPDINKLSLHKWRIYEIVNNDLVETPVNLENPL